MSGKIIAVHDADASHFKAKDKFPNLALMKISAWHKAQGDVVKWFVPIERDTYDVVYSSKIFDFTEEDPYLPENAIKGGTGYGKYTDLPDEIDNMYPDYSLYPECDYAIGFLTRGCPNKCSHCYVPQKEGDIRPYRNWQEIVRTDTKKLVLMDNNILACDHGIEQLEQLAETDYRLDINQAMSVFLVNDKIAEILSRCKWQKYIRFSVDQKAQIRGLYEAAEHLANHGVPNSKLFVYLLITDDEQDALNRLYAMRKLKGISVYGMPYKDMRKGIMPKKWQNVMAQKYIYSGQWRTIDWDEWKSTHKFYLEE